MSSLHTGSIHFARLEGRAGCQSGTNKPLCLMQVVNLVTNRVCRILGKAENTERFLGLSLYQGMPGTGGRAKRLGAGITPAESDPMLVACAYNRQRLYLFSRREPPDTDEVATGRCFASALLDRPSMLHLLAVML